MNKKSAITVVQKGSRKTVIKREFKSTSAMIVSRQFIGGNRIRNDTLWEEYTRGKQSYEQIAV